MDALLPNVKIKEVVTDAHPQITALLSKQNLCAILFEVLTSILSFFFFFFADPEHGRMLLKV